MCVLFRFVCYNCFTFVPYSKQRNTIALNRLSRNSGSDADAPNNHNRLSWPQFYNRGKASTASKAGGNDEGRTRKDAAVGGGGGGGGGGPHAAAFERVMCPDQARVMQRANQIVMYVLNVSLTRVGLPAAAVVVAGRHWVLVVGGGYLTHFDLFS